MNTNTKINQYYADIVMNKPDYIEVNNSYDRYCLYIALEKYASNWQSVWFNKSYKKQIRYALKDTCKYCFRKKHQSTFYSDYININAENISEWEEGDDYYGDESYYHKCNTCGNLYAKIWKKGDAMFTEKIPYKINIFYTPKKNMRTFVK